MIEWLLAPIDPARAHDVGVALSWHGRLMVLAWGIIAPIAIMTARFAKIWPGQDWPHELDNPKWWRLHWVGHGMAVALTIGAFVCAVIAAAPDAPLHRVLGYMTLGFVFIQFASGLLRGTKGGPTDANVRGDHFDMTPRRVVFERLHKSLGYGILALGLAAIVTGLWAANGPNWMFLVLGIFWVSLILSFVMLQRLGLAVDTYQAIWGPDPSLPGNARKPIGWGVRRLGR